MAGGDGVVGEVDLGGVDRLEGADDPLDGDAGGVL